MRRAELRERFFEMVDRFRQKGATSPDKAMTLEELGLPLSFKYLMNRRLGKLGVFVEVDGKYYLSEQRLEEIQKGKFRAGTIRDSRRKLLLLRILRIATVILFLTTLLVNLFINSLESRMISLAFLIVLLALSILQIYYLMKIRRK